MSETPQNQETNIVIASQIVRDVKVGGGATRKELAKDIARLRSGLRDKSYIPGDKLNCEFHPLKILDDGSLSVEMYGGMLRGSDADTSLDPHFHHTFHLDLRDKLTMEQVRSLSLEDLLVRHCNDVIVDAGGNAQNMAINMGLAGISLGLRKKINLIIFSSSDPLKRLPDQVRDQLQTCVQYHQLPDVADRIAIHLPWEYDNGKKGTFGLTTEPVDISAALQKLLSTRKDLSDLMKASDSFIACDPSFKVLRDHGKPPRFNTIVNAATKWRSTIAASAYGTDMVLPMNHKEAADVAHIIRHVGSEEELHTVKRTLFPSPLKTNGNEIDGDALRQLDELLVQYARYNPAHHRLSGLVTFNFPITFEEQGGLVVGTRNNKSIVAFTTTPDSDMESNFLQEFGDQKEMKSDIETMGAGDAAASMVALFNSIDPQEFITPFLEGREQSNTVLHQFAQAIFLSAVSRIVGSFLIHTKRTHLANVDLTKFGALFLLVAEESLKVARPLMSAQNDYRLSDMKKFGMKVATWNLGSVAHPDMEG